MYSLNGTIPSAIVEQRDALEAELAVFDRIRDPLTLVIKRFGDRSGASIDALEAAVGDALAGWGPIAVRVTSIDAFVDPPSGVGPVIYLVVESPGLVELHETLTEQFGTADPAIEGPNYIPHITLARGGPKTGIESLTGHRIDPIEWTSEEIHLWSVRYEQPVWTLSLPRS